MPPNCTTILLAKESPVSLLVPSSSILNQLPELTSAWFSALPILALSFRAHTDSVHPFVPGLKQFPPVSPCLQSQPLSYLSFPPPWRVPVIPQLLCLKTTVAFQCWITHIHTT